MTAELDRLMAPAVLALMVAVGSGCRRPPPGAQGDPGATERQQLALLPGRWVRQWDLGPVVYEHVLQPDHTLIQRTYAAPGSEVDTLPREPSGKPDTMYHRHYKVDLPLDAEVTGTWQCRDGALIFRTKLSNGDPLIVRRKLEHVTMTELVTSATSLAGKTHTKYVRRP